MPSGGYRAGAGRPKNQFTVEEAADAVKLPAKGFKGYIPVFPLPTMNVGDEPSEVVEKRELELWKRLWRYPQAAVWSVEKWRQDAVAHYVRMSVRVEGPGSKAADVNAMLRLRDEIGLTPVGMRANGWVIAPDEVKEKREAVQSEETAKAQRAGFKVVRGG